jgi:AcrR family transcriptional regulator
MPDDSLRAPRRAAEIAAATVALLVERGYDELTIEGVAEQAGVNKTTIYRWWPSKAALVGAAVLRGELLHFEVPDTGSLRGDLREFVRHVAHLLTTAPTAQVAQALLAAAQRAPELQEQAAAFFAAGMAGGAVITERAVRRGELPAHLADPEPLLDLVTGAIWMRTTIRRAPMPADFPDRVVDLVLDGVLTSEGTR